MQRRKKATNKTFLNQANDDAADDEEDVYDENLHLEKKFLHMRANLCQEGILVQMAYWLERRIARVERI